jgi:hypothetical protein
MGILKWIFSLEHLFELNAAKARSNYFAQYDPHYHSHSFAYRRATRMAVQHRLGLLSWRRPWAYLGDRHYSGTTGTNLTICAG